MKFIYADSLDFVDPNYNFIEDRSDPNREVYWDDQFPHEYLKQPPYDGILVSRGIVGDHKFRGKYTDTQSMRFRRVGAKKFLRIDKPEFSHLQVFGDCGAFSYANLDLPPYTPAEIVEFYEDGGFTHGCSVDHIIFEHDNKLQGMEAPDERETASEVLRRFEVTLENAEVFHRECKHISKAFTPIGVVQGWSPGSMAEAARRLVKIGYDYVALGGMVPLAHKSILEVVAAVREAVQDHIRLHILGFGKIDDVADYAKFHVTSIDTTSPLLRAFKDNRQNYFMPSKDQRMRYYTAIRIPQATESNSLKRLSSKGLVAESTLISQEKAALASVRDYDKGQASLEDVLDAVLTYARSYLIDPKNGAPVGEKKIEELSEAYRKMLQDRPWQECDCEVCKRVGVEAAIFRASNRNKRRGIHNMWVFQKQLRRLTGTETQRDSDAQVQSR